MSTNHDDRGERAATEDRELRALFAPRRPDAERFRAGVAERLRRAGGSGDGGVPAAPTAVGWRERAASMLPALPPGTSLGSTLGAWLSLPALLFVGCLAAFWRGDRSMVGRLRSARATMPRRRPSATTGTFWPRRAFLLPAALLGGAFAALGFFFDLSTVEDVALVVLLGSMMVLVGQIGALALHHGAPTAAVGACVVDLLWAAVFGLSIWRMFGDSAAWGGSMRAAGLVIGWGGLAAELLRRWRTREFGLVVLWGVVAVGLAALALPRMFAPAGNDALRGELAQAAPPGADGTHWRALELCGEALRAGGEAVPDLASLRQHLAGVIAAQPGPWPETWSAGARLGLITKEQWLQLERTEYVGYHLPRLLLDHGSLPLFAHDRYLLDALLMTDELSDGERAHLVERIERSWPDLEAPSSVDVGQALLCMQWLDRLGRADLVTARAAMLRELLRRCWVAPATANRTAEVGGFAALPGERAFLQHTIDALELLVRIGPPPEIALPALRAFLQRHTRGAPLAWLDGWGKQAFAGLALLDAALPMPPRGVGQWLIDERLFVGSLLLVVLSLRAVWFTRPLGARGRGALP